MAPDPRVVLDSVGPHFGQVGLVVRDLERTAAAHARLGPYRVYTYDRSTVPGLKLAGSPADFRFRIAINPHMPQLEIIQPLDDASPYATWLAQRGPGMHHFGFYVDDFEAATQALARAGYLSVMSGSGFGADGSGAYDYFDTVDDLGYLTEVIRVPEIRREPEAIIGD